MSVAPRFTGTVTKASAMAKTATVSITRHVEHPILRKRLHRMTNYLVHDPEQRAQIDDVVLIRPYKVSARKNFVLDQILKRRGKLYEDAHSSSTTTPVS